MLLVARNLAKLFLPNGDVLRKELDEYRIILGSIYQALRTRGLTFNDLLQDLA
jgi:hypothetical protein